MYIPLRVHSVYSKGKGAAALAELAAWASHHELPFLALSDLGNLYGWGRWKRRAGEHGFSPIFGCEIEISEETFVFLVRNTQGYRHLVEIFNRRKIQETAGLIVIFVPRSGGGIPEDVLPHVFEPFYTTKEEGKGTGLGLSLAYRIVENHRGRLTARNKPEGGAAFIIELPMIQENGDKHGE